MKKLTPRQINAQRKKDGKPPLNFALFRKVVRKLETSPEAYDQSTTAEPSDESPCGTAACIGGWADILSAPNQAEAQARMAKVSLDRGADSLGLDGEQWFDEYGTERAALFSGDPERDWPRPFSSQWDEAQTPQQRARVAVRYLNRVIATGEVQ